MFFFFQAEDGIRDRLVTGVQTCALPISNAGFPAGKLKTIILEIPVGSFTNNDYRIRISTNLEIYWDRLAFATRSETKTQTIPIELRSADLGYMGFPVMSRVDAVAPNIPDYNDIRHGHEIGRAHV